MGVNVGVFKQHHRKFTPCVRAHIYIYIYIYVCVYTHVHALYVCRHASM